MVFNNNLLLGAAGQGGGYEIDQSIRFNDDDSAYLTRTPGSEGNRRTFTFSTWVKFCTIKAENILFSSWIASGPSAYALIYIDTNFNLRFEDQNASRIITNQVFKDTSAWYHVVVRVDTTDGTSGDRYQMYINGSRVTSFSVEVQPALNYQTNVNKTQPHYLGRNGYSLAMFYSDLYQAETHFIDGTALDPTSFGEYNDDGVWIPKAYTGSYGTNGFYITGATASDLGEDFSGNGNDFTSTGLTTADQMLDTPTLNYCTMNVLDNGRPANITVSDGNLTCAFAGAGYNGGIRSSFFFDSEDSDGWYAECTLDSLALASVFRAGVANASLNLASNDAQTSADGWAYSDQGAKLNNSYTTGYGSSVGVGDVVGIAVRNGKIYFAINNTWQGSANPVTEANAAFTNLTGDVAFCQSTNTGGSYAHTATWNFGQSGFTYTPPTGYKALNTANLATPSITDGSAHFNPVLFTGNSGVAFSVTGVGFQPDWVWGKPRSYADNHRLMDVVRGSTKQLITNATNAEFTQAQGITSFDSDGFTVGTHNGLNTGTNTYVGWCWLADNTTGSSNEDGATTSTVSANTTSGFSIVKWTGTGANTTLGHGLGAAPKMILVKNTGAADSWVVYHEDVGATKGLTLNSTAAPTTASTFFNNTAPTSSVFSVGSGGRTNGSSDGMIAYCFAEIPGYSSFSSYTGNGSATNGPFVYTGFKPKYILYKSTTSGTRWGILDTDRSASGGGNSVGDQLFAELANAEANADHEIDFLSNGFKVRDASGSVNGNGYTITYMAFAENPFGGDGVAPATAR